MRKIYDAIVVGGGAAGVSAAVYAKRYGLSVLLISKNIGGLAADAHIICNLITYEEIKGMEFMQKLKKQLEYLNIETVYDEVYYIKRKKGAFEVGTESNKYKSGYLIIATGGEKRKLNVPGENELLGKGVSYCATCDAAFYKDKVVGVAGGSDAATTSALLLSEFAKKVYIIYRRGKLRGEYAWIEKVLSNPKIKAIYNAKVIALRGKEKLEYAELDNGKTLKLDGIFVEIGIVPKTELVKDFGVNVDKNGYIITDNKQKTNVKGVYAAGDVTSSELKQIITAACQGALAAYDVYNEVKKTT